MRPAECGVQDVDEPRARRRPSARGRGRRPGRAVASRSAIASAACTAVRVPANLSGAISTRMAAILAAACVGHAVRHEPGSHRRRDHGPGDPAPRPSSASPPRWASGGIPMLSPDPPTFTGIAIDPNGPVASVHGDEQYVWGRVMEWDPIGRYTQEFWLGHPEDEATVLDVRFTEAPEGIRGAARAQRLGPPAPRTFAQKFTHWGDLLTSATPPTCRDRAARPADARGRPRGVRRDHRDRPTTSWTPGPSSAPGPTPASGRPASPWVRAPHTRWAPTRGVAGSPRPTASWSAPGVLHPRADVDPGVLRRPPGAARGRHRRRSCWRPRCITGGAPCAGCSPPRPTRGGPPLPARRVRPAPADAAAGLGRRARRSRSSSGCATGPQATST